MTDAEIRSSIIDLAISREEAGLPPPYEREVQATIRANGDRVGRIWRELKAERLIDSRGPGRSRQDHDDRAATRTPPPKRSDAELMANIRREYRERTAGGIPEPGLKCLADRLGCGVARLGRLIGHLERTEGLPALRARPDRCENQPAPTIEQIRKAALAVRALEESARREGRAKAQARRPASRWRREVREVLGAERRLRVWCGRWKAEGGATP